VKWDDDLQSTLVAYCLVAAPTLLVVAALAWRRSSPLLPIPRLKVGRWSGAAVAGHFILFFMAILAADAALDYAGVYRKLLPEDGLAALAEKRDTDRERDEAIHLIVLRRQNLATPLAMLMFLAGSFVLLPLLHESRISQAGMTMIRWRANVVVGGAGFLVATPIVFAIFAACKPLTPVEPHGIEVLGRSRDVTEVEWIVLFVGTVLLVPIAEEWYFRGIVQGWLRRATLRGQSWFILMTVTYVGLNIAFLKISRHAAPIPLIAWAGMLALIYGIGVYRLFLPVLREGVDYFVDGDAGLALGQTESPEMDGDPSTTDFFAEEQERASGARRFGARWERWKQAAARWAIVGSSMMFALLHGAWPSQIPLFALALVLGWLAYRTQSLLPSIIAHSLFNLVSCVMLIMIAHSSGNKDAVAVRTTPSIENVKTVPGSWWPR
jgi:membrane protease YdiL (CAAX protease family)